MNNLIINVVGGVLFGYIVSQIIGEWQTGIRPLYFILAGLSLALLLA